MTGVAIREAEATDWPALWPIVRDVLRAADTYTMPPDMAEAEARAWWFPGAPDGTRVAVAEGTVLGTSHLSANRQGPGDHVMNASYMVAAAARGKGVGRALVEDSLNWGRAQGFRAVVFNAVTEVNPAIPLYQSFGFRIVGTVPGTFRHPEHGDIALHVMHKVL